LFTSPSSFLIGSALGTARSSNKAVEKTPSAMLPPANFEAVASAGKIPRFSAPDRSLKGLRVV
jgi:hypothetical protein